MMTYIWSLCVKVQEINATYYLKKVGHQISFFDGWGESHHWKEKSFPSGVTSCIISCRGHIYGRATRSPFLGVGNLFVQEKRRMAVNFSGEGSLLPVFATKKDAHSKKNPLKRLFPPLQALLLTFRNRNMEKALGGEGGLSKEKLFLPPSFEKGAYKKKLWRANFPCSPLCHCH